jgi:hypothetical protein
MVFREMSGRSIRYVGLHLPEATANELRDEADRLGLSGSAVVTAALSAFLPGLRAARRRAEITAHDSGEGS